MLWYSKRYVYGSLLFSSASIMAMTSIAKSINIAIAILLKRSFGIAFAITFATSIAIAIVLSSIAYNPG
jgi:hypothetical protein